MQIFKDKNFVTGIEYRDDKGAPIDGSVIVPDTGPMARKILAGFDFDFKAGKVTVMSEKRPDVLEQEQKDKERKDAQDIENRKAAKRAAKREAITTRIKGLARKDITDKDVKDIVFLLAEDAGYLATELEDEPAPEVTP